MIQQSDIAFIKRGVKETEKFLQGLKEINNDVVLLGADGYNLRLSISQINSAIKNLSKLTKPTK